METQTGVTPDSPQDVEIVTPEVMPNTEDTVAESSKPPKGFVPLAALQEERRKTELLEQELENVKSSISPEEELDPRFVALSKEVQTLKDDRDLDEVIAQYPVLKGMKAEVKDFRASEHPRAKMTSVAKLFMAEKGLLEPQRQGLEKQTGGDRASVSQGMTSDEVSELMKTNYKEYVRLLREGKLQVKS